MYVYNKIENFMAGASANFRILYNKFLNMEKKWIKNKKVKQYMKIVFKTLLIE